MLSLCHASRTLGRRDFLRIGTAAGLALPWLQGRGALAAGNLQPVTGKSVVFLFQQGGPSQFETFDPKPDAPDGVRTIGGTIPTSAPGVHFGSGMEHLAKWAHRMAVVRSFQTGTQHGGLLPIVGKRTGDASIGAYYNRVAGTTNPDNGLPRSAALWPKSVDPESLGPRDEWGRFHATGRLGAGFAPFIPGADGPMQQSMQLRMPIARLEDRRNLLASLDGLQRRLDAAADIGGINGLRGQAFDVLLGDAADAFDISKEDPQTIARYDTSHFYAPDSWKDKNNRDNYAAHTKTLGKLMLLARRLCERGCGVVTVNTEFVWDMHADVNNLEMTRGMDVVGRPFDHAVAAFIEDCESRGLADNILLVCCGEMGRTPKINKNGGRDHWPKLAPLMLYGGGLTDGQLIGASTRDGGEPAERPLSPDNLLATIFHTLIDHGQARLIPGLPSDVLRNLEAIEKFPRIL